MKHKIIRLILLSALSITLVGGTVAYAEPDIPQTRDVMPEVGNGGGSSTDNKDDKEEGGSGGKLNKEEQQKLLDEINASMDRSAELETLLSIYACLSTSGIDDEHAAAILVNGIRECSLVPDAGQSGGGAIGLWQWDGGRRDELQVFSAEMNDQVYTIKGFKIGGIATQVAFMLKELSGGQWTAKSPKGLYTSVDWKEAQSKSKDKNFDYSKKMSIDEWKALDDPVALSIYFTACFERCAYGIDIAKEGGIQANTMYKLISGAEVTGNTNKELDKEIGETMVMSGLWKETDFVKWKTSTRSELKFADIQNLHNNDIYDVENWKVDINKRNSESILIKGGRWLTILFGIIFNVWMLLIYISYWFDRLNNFFDYSMLNLVTFGKLSISPDENECTFSLTSLGKGDKRTVNHRKVVEIVVIGLAFGTLIVSGVFFQILGGVVNKILEILY